MQSHSCSIDRFASGALLFAKTGSDRHGLVRQFLDHTPVRQYLAVLRGRLGVEARTLVHYFRREGVSQQLRTARDPQAARAELRYSVERLFADASLVRVELVTGLQNQIRAQFSAMGHPVIGDRKYHRVESSEQLIARVALHAAILSLSIRAREERLDRLQTAPRFSAFGSRIVAIKPCAPVSTGVRLGRSRRGLHPSDANRKLRPKRDLLN